MGYTGQCAGDTASDTAGDTTLVASGFTLDCSSHFVGGPT